MVLKRLKNRYGILFTIISLIIVTSCDKEMLVLVKCDECLTEEPSTAKLLIKVSISEYLFSSVSIIVYEGDNADGRVIYSNERPLEITEVSVAINRTYTIEAIYMIEGRTYRAIDSVRPEIKYSESDCDEPCYYIYNNSVNLRLKYT